MQMYIVLGIMVFMIVSLILNKWPYGLTAMICCILLALTGIMDVENAFSGLSMKNTILIAGMYVISDAFGRTSMISNFRKRMMTMQSGKSDFLLIAILMAINIFFAQFLPASANITVMIMIINVLSSDGEVCASRLLLPVAALSSLWSSKIPIGMGTTGYLTMNKYISSYHSDQLLVVTDRFMVSCLPLITGTLFTLFAYKLLPKRQIDASKLKKIKETDAISKRDEAIIYAVFLITMAAMFLNSVLGDLMYIVPVIGVVILMLTKAMSQKDVQKVLSSDQLFMIAGVLVMAEALAASGAGEAIGNSILTVLGGNPGGIKVLVVFAIVTVVMTTFLSNSGSRHILEPLAVATAISAGFDPRGIVLVVNLCSCCSTLLPTGAPATAIAFAAGNYKLSETLKYTVPLTVIVMVSAILSANFFFPVYGR